MTRKGTTRMYTKRKAFEPECLTCPLDECYNNSPECPIYPDGADNPAAARERIRRQAGASLPPGGKDE
jgi:hypothetical protein